VTCIKVLEFVDDKLKFAGHRHVRHIVTKRCQQCWGSLSDRLCTEMWTSLKHNKLMRRLYDHIWSTCVLIIIIIINAKIKVTLNKKMLQGHFTKIINVVCHPG